MRAAISGQRGFTLIELSVAIVIIIMAMTLIGFSIANIRKADLKASSGMMAGAMRYLYNLAIINNTPYRLVVDMDEGVFWGEELQTDDPCQRYLPESDDETGKGGRREGRMSRAKSSRGGRGASPIGAAGGGRGGGGRSSRGSPEASPDGVAPGGGGGGYGRRKDNLLTERKLPTGILVTRAITAHHTSAQQEGRVAVHFFPGGYAEKAYVWLGEQSTSPDEDDEELVTIELDGLMGRVTRHYDVLEERDFLKWAEEENE